MNIILEREHGLTFYMESRTKNIHVRGRIGGRQFKFSTQTQDMARAKTVAFNYVFATTSKIG